MSRTLESLIRQEGRHVGTEAFGLDKMSTAFSSIFGSTLLSRMSDRVRDIFTPIEKTRFGLNAAFDKRIVAWANRESYMVLGDITVYAPVGLKVSYMEYIDALEKALPYVLSIENDLLQPLSALLGSCLNDPSIMASKSGLQIKSNLLKTQIDVVTKPIAACYDPDEKSDTVQYRQAFRRNKEIVDVTQRQLQLQDNLTRSNVSNVLNKSVALFEIAAALAEAIKDDDSFEEYRSYKDISAKNNHMLAETMYRAAQWIEFTGVYHHQVMVLSTALKDTEEKLAKMAK